MYCSEVVRATTSSVVTKRWYQDVLGIEGEQAPLDPVLTQYFGASDQKSTRFLVGNESLFFIEVSEIDASLHKMPGNHVAFQHLALVVSDIDSAYQKLAEHGVEFISDGIQTLPEWNKAAAGIRAFYFYDCNGYPLECIWYPKGKGQERWQEECTTSAFSILGIDHTALTTGEGEECQKFYEGLGFLKTDGSCNYGLEQEKLSGVQGARVDITGFTSNENRKYPLGVELLTYVEPPLLEAESEKRNQVTVMRGNEIEPGLYTDPTGHQLCVLTQ